MNRPPRSRRCAGAVRPLFLAFVVLAVTLLARAFLRSEAEATDRAEGQAPVAAAEERGATTALLEVAVTPPGPPAWNAPLAGRIARWKDEAVRRSPAVESADQIRVSVCVRDIATGEELCALEADRALTPASNMKLVTTAAALVLLGPGMEFVTRFDAVGTFQGSVLEGDLVVRAGGDPLVRRGAEELVEAPLRAVAQRLVADGLRHVRGDLVLDEGRFADPAPAPGWPDEKQHWASYCALSGGFSVNGGVLEAVVDPGAVGSKAAITVSPAEHGLKRRYDVDTVKSGPLEVMVGATRSTVTVRGKLPHKVGPYEAEFSHFDPVVLFGAVLRAELERAGLRIDGDVVRRRGAGEGRSLATLHSPLVGVLEAINARSENGVADQVFLTLGQVVAGEGTRAGGERAARQALRRLEVEADEFVQADGSGLSRDNRVSARQVVGLLAAVLQENDETARLYRSSLAVAGESGTLEDRMGDTAARGRVFAKTGWISGASSLSGVLETVEGRSLAFSILVAYPRQGGGLNRRCFKPMQDELVTALVEETP